ncbi:MAG: alpha/beta hydrolase [Rhodopseudomonas sp.]|uniref:alpha/beta fold hydrolase n=1 Tax=Rhodopseudomonas sp. TaxID=1078 RepID=UPI0018296682|nr:alpha/beta hydrolase [Rhodopseudomonas sp.]NVN88695.1 alpha/beta hydrolase [Rhodopseudomonas sp.]
MVAASQPVSRFYESQGLRLHFVDWGNPAAPPLFLIHGGLDHCRSWDRLARVLQPHFHVMAPDLRGHGDSEWAKASSYSLADNVYDLSRLMRAAEVETATIVAHSMGGMVALAYAGTFPSKFSRLAVLDGAFLPSTASAPIHEQIAGWVTQLDKISNAEVRGFRDIGAAAARMQAHNRRLSADLALHLATHGSRPNPDGSYSWKYDPYQRVRAPYRLSPDDYAALWARITCPTLLLYGDESFLADPEKAGLLAHFAAAESKTIAGAGHWLHHDKPDEVVAALTEFLDLPGVAPFDSQ